MNEYNQFIAKLMDGLRENVKEGYYVSFRKTIENNGVEQDSVTIGRGEKEEVLPNIPLQPYYGAYLNGRKIDRIVREIIRKGTRMVDSELADGIKNIFQFSKDGLIAKVVNYEKNKEMLRHIPHDRVLDLAITYRVLPNPTDDTKIAVIVTNQLLDKWGIDKGELKMAAYSNMERTFPHYVKSIGGVCVSHNDEYWFVRLDLLFEKYKKYLGVLGVEAAMQTKNQMMKVLTGEGLIYVREEDGILRRSHKLMNRKDNERYAFINKRRFWELREYYSI